MEETEDAASIVGWGTTTNSLLQKLESVLAENYSGIECDSKWLEINGRVKKLGSKPDETFDM